MHALPWALLADVVRQLVKPAVVIDDEDVVVGDGAEGLVLHLVAPTRTIVAPRVSQTLAEGAWRSAFASVPLKELLIPLAQRTARERIEARGL